MGERWPWQRVRTLTCSVLILALVQCGKGASDDEQTDEGNPACEATCDDRCSAFVGCGFDVQASCADECKNSLQHADCRGFRPADQYTCDELAEVNACAAYCHEFCVWASACGSFNQQTCIEGCAYEKPTLCNPASVAARTCDELKPEARMYDDIGQLLQGDSEFAYGGSFFNYREYGLCLEAQDCELPETCSLATNTCGACAEDADCDRGLSSKHYVCSTGQCLEVACVVDDDCFTGRCRADTHTCVDCLADTDCDSFFTKCNPETLECVRCLDDSQCSDESYFKRCDTAEHQCVECLTDDDCPDGVTDRSCSVQHLCQ